MAVEIINPPGLAAPEAYAHLSVTTGTRTVYLSGQVARDAEGRPVGTGDLAAQAFDLALQAFDLALRPLAPPPAGARPLF